MVSSISKPKILTLEEFLTLPETQPASEYIEGQIVQKPSERTLFVYHPKQETAVFEPSDDGLLPIPEFAQGFELTLSDLFDWLL